MTLYHVQRLFSVGRYERMVWRTGKSGGEQFVAYFKTLSLYLPEVLGKAMKKRQDMKSVDRVRSEYLPNVSQTPHCPTKCSLLKWRM